MKKYILITGCAFYNKGSQAMLFNTVDELRKRFPDKEVIMLSSMDYKKDNSNYTFRVFPDYLARLLPFPMSAFRCMGKLVLSKESVSSEEKTLIKELDSILKSSYMIVDAAGYALSSRWKPEWRSFIYLMKIAVAEKYKIPMYLMQQSFGPFDYSGIMGKFIYSGIKKYLRYPRIVFPREKEGYDCVSGLRKGRTMRMDDIVLLNSALDIRNVYRITPDFKSCVLESASNKVAIIPNMTCIEQANDYGIDMMDIYKALVSKLLEKYEVYIVKHSNDDEKVCVSIKNMFADNDQVHLLIDELNCIEFEYLVRQFNFCVASRFHSIVHSYKNSIPCIVLGWAIKYKDLLSSFNQEKYLFDIRESLNKDDILERTDQMIKNNSLESQMISRSLENIQSINTFDIVYDDIVNYYGGTE